MVGSNGSIKGGRTERREGIKGKGMMMKRKKLKKRNRKMSWRPAVCTPIGPFQGMFESTRAAEAPLTLSSLGSCL